MRSETLYYTSIIQTYLVKTKTIIPNELRKKTTQNALYTVHLKCSEVNITINNIVKEYQ